MELGKVLLVGSTGYLGSHLATSLGLDVIARSETTKQSRDRSFDTIIHASHFGDLTAEKEFISSLPGDCYFVFFSSAAVYGDTGLEGASVEDEPKPINDYGRYKLELENLIRNKFPQHLILRISNPYGKENRPGGAYQIFKQAIADKQPVKIYADQPETVFRDFIYIDDFISQASTA
ncbi:MAG: SDR family oxidoreductase, partial [Candidatus Melainabacteria bacterium]|nr:SDR family oxidoreductase [Candidatus Melainabacteria bacterium]